MKYWRREGYLGLGPSAHGLLFPQGSGPCGIRTANPPSLDGYSRALREGRPAWSNVEPGDRENAWKDFLIFGLRLAEGVSIPEGEKRYGPPPSVLRGAVERLVATGYLLPEADRLRMPERHWFVSNEILGRFA
jgi:oxygen-independent coproporphyrinogen-3 oxidase